MAFAATLDNGPGFTARTASLLDMTIQPPHPAPAARIPAGISRAADYARLAPDVLDPAIFAHLEGGSGDDRSAAANLAAFADLAIVPRVLRPVHHGNIACTLDGVARPHPVMLAPLGSQRLFHSEAECAAAAAAAAVQACFVASTMASVTMEDIAAVAGADRWFQLYFQPDRADTLGLVRRAEAAGYAALVVTVDTPVQLPSCRALDAGFRAPDDFPNLRNRAARPAAPALAGQGRILNGFMRDAPTLDDIDWLLAETRLPLWIKGVMHAADARELVGRGAAGIVVSNHGGRALDDAPSTLSRLPAIRHALGDAVPLLLDGGIRSGSDIFKAIASGADAVLVGRLQACALAVAGALGVAHMVRLLCEELEACMALAGCATLADVRRAELAPFVGGARP